MDSVSTDTVSSTRKTISTQFVKTCQWRVSGLGPKRGEFTHRFLRGRLGPTTTKFKRGRKICTKAPCRPGSRRMLIPAMLLPVAESNWILMMECLRRCDPCGSTGSPVLQLQSSTILSRPPTYPKNRPITLVLFSRGVLEIDFFLGFRRLLNPKCWRQTELVSTFLFGAEQKTAAVARHETLVAHIDRQSLVALDMNS